MEIQKNWANSARCGNPAPLWNEMYPMRCFDMVREGPAETPPPPKEPYPAEKARGGEIILRTPARRAIFLAGIISAVVLAAIVLVLAR
jgi:hypothetical protein